MPYEFYLPPDYRKDFPISSRTGKDIAAVLHIPADADHIKVEYGRDCPFVEYFGNGKFCGSEPVNKTSLVDIVEALKDAHLPDVF